VQELISNLPSKGSQGEHGKDKSQARGHAVQVYADCEKGSPTGLQW
jgi:hypothetical protein